MRSFFMKGQQPPLNDLTSNTSQSQSPSRLSIFPDLLDFAIAKPPAPITGHRHGRRHTSGNRSCSYPPVRGLNLSKYAHSPNINIGGNFYNTGRRVLVFSPHPLQLNAASTVSSNQPGKAEHVHSLQTQFPIVLSGRVIISANGFHPANIARNRSSTAHPN
jgi:hypothetical protein